jgi:hypothetical protein
MRDVNTLGLQIPVERSLREAMGSDPIQGGERAPKATLERLTSENVGNATGRESYAFGTPVVVTGVTTRQGAWESHVQGKGATLERGPEGTF